VEAAATILRSHGVRFAFDDLGTAYSHLPSIAAVRPSYLKISQDFGTSCEANPAHRKIIENVQALAASFSSEVVLEGIETEETATFARDTGIRFGQGFFYSRPAESSALVARYS
jgi:EAL domain-containing protein (putative c-di-GMP-specific phosphodiesterase class I)